jgi:hypothetical protein
MCSSTLISFWLVNFVLIQPDSLFDLDCEPLKIGQQMLRARVKNHAIIDEIG